jgi:lysophospholipid acyltransferase (LPLAT)-like uncharacterized protein
VSDARVRWIVRAGTALIRLLGMTWRMRPVNDADLVARRASGQRVIFTLWHGELLPLLWHHRGEGIAVVISEHRDGEIIAQIAERLGYTTVRGSTSRGGGRALIGLMRAIEAGRDGAVTPDGPRGPAHVFAPGAAIASQRTGAPLAMLRATATRAWRLKSWDRFLVPKPCATVRVIYGPLVSVDAGSPREAAEQAPRLQAALDAVPGG